jgi:hypothetical protein
MEHFIGCWLRILGICYGLFDADDLLAFRTLAEAMTSTIRKFRLNVRRSSFLLTDSVRSIAGTIGPVRCAPLAITRK